MSSGGDGIRTGGAPAAGPRRSVAVRWSYLVAVALVLGACSGAGGSTDSEIPDDAAGSSSPDLEVGAGMPEAVTPVDRAALEALREAVVAPQAGDEGATGGRFVMPQVETADSRLFMVGDSVLEASWPTVAALLPSWDVTADAEVGRRTAEGIATLEQRRAEVGDVAVVVLGHNYQSGEGFEALFEGMMSSLAGLERVVWVTPAEWSEGQAEVGAVIRLAPARFANVVVADWASLTRENPGYLQGDRVHLTAAGVVALADLIARSVGPGPLGGGVLVTDVPAAPSPPATTSSPPPTHGGTPTPRPPTTSSSLPPPPPVTTTSTATPSSTASTAPVTTTIPPVTETLPP